MFCVDILVLNLFLTAEVCVEIINFEYTITYIRSNLSQQVDHVFTVPLSVLCKAENRRYTIFKGNPYVFPVYFGGPRRIWGLTGFILDVVLNILLNP